MEDKLILLIVVFSFLLVATYKFRKNNSFIKSIGFQTFILLILVGTLFLKIYTFTDSFGSYSQIFLVILSILMTLPRYIQKIKAKSIKKTKSS